MKKLAVKICGVNDPASVKAAVEAGADLLGVVFFAKSPRFVTAPAAAELFDPVPDTVLKVGLLVDPDDDLLDRVASHVRLDYLQLHGQETPQRLEEIRLSFGRPVIKAVGVASAADIDDAVAAYGKIADRLLFDAKPPAGAERPGGNAASFDWTLLAGRRWTRPWLLAGGLTPDNVAEAIRQSGAKAVDVSSGVESAPGVKDAQLIRRFIAAAKGNP
jgi:phosphoribosylanthranilate isomerase